MEKVVLQLKQHTRKVIICIDCEKETYLNVAKKTRGCRVCGWETFWRSE